MLNHCQKSAFWAFDIFVQVPQKVSVNLLHNCWLICSAGIKLIELLENKLSEEVGIIIMCLVYYLYYATFFWTVLELEGINFASICNTSQIFAVHISYR